MKKIAIALALAATVISAQAEEVFLTNNSANTESWFGYPESFTKIKDAYSVLIAKRFANGNPDQRMYAAVSFVDCTKGYGSLYLKDTEKDAWSISSNFSFSANRTVGDTIAANICNAGKEIEKSSKPAPKKTSSKSA